MPTPQIRKVVQAAAMFLAVAAFVSINSAQTTAGTKPPVKIQGETIGAAGAQPVVTQSMTNSPRTETPAANGKYLPVAFDKLGYFEFDPPSTTKQAGSVDEADKLIPPEVKVLDNKKVTLRGYMIPIATEGNNTTEFLLVRISCSCCYGSPPKLNEVVTVKVPGKGVKEELVQPVTVKGTLHVGTIRDAGDVTGLYRMDGEALVGE
jgi:hypothetical protein